MPRIVTPNGLCDIREAWARGYINIVERKTLQNGNNPEVFSKRPVSSLDSIPVPGKKKAGHNPASLDHSGNVNLPSFSHRWGPGRILSFAAAVLLPVHSSLLNTTGDPLRRSIMAEGFR
jgi:hypothetical protein